VSPDPEVDEAQAVRRANSGARALAVFETFIGGSLRARGVELNRGLPLLD
jgi:hypothetical protein